MENSLTCGLATTFLLMLHPCSLCFSLWMAIHLIINQVHVIRSAANEKVIMFCLPPHTTHLTQPLDKGCFGPLKMHWQQECWSYITTHPDRVITHYQFPKLFGQA